jgi:nitrate/nitrite transporter NarK
MFVAGTAVMQLFLIFVVLVFSVALILYASPIILYIAPLIVIGLVISFLTDSIRHHSKTARH